MKNFTGKLTDYVQAEKDVAAEYELYVIDSYNESGINAENIKQYSDDGVHFNESGRKKIAEFLASKLYAKYHQ